MVTILNSFPCMKSSNTTTTDQVKQKQSMFIIIECVIPQQGTAIVVNNETKVLTDVKGEKIR